MHTTSHRQQLEPARIDARGDRSATGRLGERLAADHLVAIDGLTLLARNWRVAAGELRGELDVVAIDERDATLVVCEVKTRRDAARFGGAVAALGDRQRVRLRALTAAFLRESAPSCRRVRLDLIAVDLGRTPSLTHLVAAL
jgi:Holliday junction resolvase-like predicted endonuclease